MRLGVLRNPASTGNLGRPAPVLPDGVVLAETAGPRDCAEALARIGEARPDLVVVDGGDGTVRDAISRFPAVFGADWPRVAVLANGNTNLVAKRMGAVRPDDLHRLAGMPAEEVEDRLRPARVLRIDVPGRSVLHGFIAGWGAYATATRIAREEIASRHGTQVVATMLATLRRSVVGPEAATLRRGVACTLRAEGHPEIPGRRFIGIATSLPRRIMGPLSPFWGEGEGHVRWLDVLAPPRRLAFSVPFAAFGRPTAAMRRGGYLSGRTRRLELTLGPGEGGLVLDGEQIAGQDGLAAIITADETVRWLDLRRPVHSTARGRARRYAP